MINNLIASQKVNNNFTVFDKYIQETLYQAKQQTKLFHIDCKYSRRRICYCDYTNISLLNQDHLDKHENIYKYLKVVYSGANDYDLKQAYMTNQINKERIKNIKDKKDIIHLAPKYAQIMQKEKEKEMSKIRNQITQDQINKTITGECYYCKNLHANKYYEININQAELITACEDCYLVDNPKQFGLNKDKLKVQPKDRQLLQQKRQEAQKKRLETIKAKKLLKSTSKNYNSESQEKQITKQKDQDLSQPEEDNKNNQKTEDDIQQEEMEEDEQQAEEEQENDEDEQEDSYQSEQTKECNWDNCKKKDKSDPNDVIVCKGCSKSFHTECCDPPLEKAIVTKYEWFCTECKLCLICKKNTNENELLICDCCDRPFHMSCIEPKRTQIPEGRWFCNNCNNCLSCGISLFQNYNNEILKKYSQQLVEDRIVCDDCWVYYLEKKYCPLCNKIFEENAEGDYVQCDKCKLWLHFECENKLSGKSIKEIKKIKQFCCSKCKNQLILKK